MASLNSYLSVKIKKGEKSLLCHKVILGREKSQNISSKCLENFEDTAAMVSQLNISTKVEVFNFRNGYYKIKERE